MFFTEKITEMSTEMLNGYLEKIKKDPEKYDQMLKMALLGMEIGTVFLKESKEFREAFARVHAEFLKYPESKEVIEQAQKTYSKIN